MAKESYTGRINRKLMKKLRIVEVAAGREKADLVLKNAAYVNVFSSQICRADIAVAEGLIVGMGTYSGVQEVDVSGKIVLPGFLDAHIHLESAMVSPGVVADPHEIANVMGADGIEYMLQATEDLPVDVRFMLPSCVPATPMDESGAVLDYRTIDSFYDHPRVQGLAEMMNYPGGPPQEDRRPRPGPSGQRPQRIHRRRGLFGPRVPRRRRRRCQAGAGAVHHDPGGHRRPEFSRPHAPHDAPVRGAVHVLLRRQAPQ